MVLSLLVVANATETGNGSVYLKTKKEVSGNAVTYTFTLDASKSTGVGALEFYVEPTGLKYSTHSFPEGTKLQDVFEAGNKAGEGLSGTADFKGDQNYFIAYGGNAKANPPRVLKGSVILVSVTYTITDSKNYGLTVKPGSFKACLSGEQAKLEETRYECVAEDVDSGGSKVVLGDVNGDKKISLGDILMIRDYMLSRTELTDTQRQAADVNGDNRVSLGDIVMIRDYMLGRISSFD